MNINKSQKVKKWTGKNYLVNAGICFLNDVILFAIFLLVLALGGLSGKTALTVSEFFSNVNGVLVFIFTLILVSSALFLFHYYFQSDTIKDGINTEMMFLVLDVSLIIRYVFGLYVNIFLMPVTIAALLTGYLINKKSALFNSLLFSMITFLFDIFSGITGADSVYVLFTISIASSVVAVLCVDSAYSRIGLLTRSFLISIYAFVGSVILVISQGINGGVTIFKYLISGAFSGPLSAGIFMIILPLFETLFSKFTRFKLAELTDHKSNLIKRLIEEAPGTFNHSILVSNIAEACATAIGEDALLARTCAYYHDIGKLRRPEYFGENNVGGTNPHDALTPELSVNIIRAHTIDGYNLLLKHNFPKEIASVCKEHHGNMPIYYFFDKAKKFTDGEVNIADYCYTEDKPQSKIAAIIMIADSSEAAIRTLTDRSREKVKETVDKIVQDRMEMGQFDDCEITLKELSIIKNTVVNNITGIYHKRVEYPNVIINQEQKEEVKEKETASKEKSEQKEKENE